MNDATQLESPDEVEDADFTIEARKIIDEKLSSMTNAQRFDFEKRIDSAIGGICARIRDGEPGSMLVGLVFLVRISDALKDSK